MTSAATAEHEPPDGRPIGAVLKELQADFPDLTISKIRYLEGEGLVSPLRRASGYRLFTEADVARLRFTLTAQRDRFWPLKVIRDALDRLDQGLDVPGLTSPAEEDSVTEAAPASAPTPSAPGVADISAAALRRRRAVRLSPAELRERTGLDPAAYGQLKAFGLLRTDASGRHHADDIDVATAAAALSRFGMEARHLRSFRVGADREIGLANQVLEPVRRRQARGAPGADHREVEAELLSTMLSLHIALVRSGLAER
ncbi:MerR family transcriptional regulator [Ornithinimicrobium sp. Y1847]|uniref:transcriptional regulator FtsR n=1 Tax=unclassified Ornithinimicrobium TaxID=2615080 RepID=UPI003B685A13